MTSIPELFPPRGLRITSGPLELRGIGEPEMLALLDVVRDGVHDPATMPFSFPWTDAPADELPLNYLQWWSRHVTDWTPAAWSIDLAAVWEGEVVGVQGVTTRDFLVTRGGETGSWVGRRFHGRGIGTAMRRAWVAFLFGHLGFEYVTSSAFVDNAASLRVSEKLGYRPNGSVWYARRGERAECRRLLLRREDFTGAPPIAVEGVEAARRFIGIVPR
mgnify:CR=1 FL=1